MSGIMVKYMMGSIPKQVIQKTKVVFTVNWSHCISD